MDNLLQKRLSLLEDFISLPVPKISFEFFPPKTDEMEKSLWETIKKLEPLNPDFVSVTYGAGGTTRERTHQTVKRIRDETGLEPAAHLTCVGAPRSEIDEIAQSYWDAGIKHIVALRGDPPRDKDKGGFQKYEPHPDGYAYCKDLVEGLRKIADFEISVAAFPEVHPEAVSAEEDLDHLKRKLDAGATRAISQYFFGPDIYLSFLEKARKAGIDAPIIPGIIMINSFKQLINFSKMCNTTVPDWMYSLLEGTDEHPEKRDYISAMIAAEQCRVLREAGIEQFHFYTLNRPTLSTVICHILGIRKKDE